MSDIEIGLEPYLSKRDSSTASVLKLQCLKYIGRVRLSYAALRNYIAYGKYHDLPDGMKKKVKWIRSKQRPILVIGTTTKMTSKEELDSFIDDFHVTAEAV